MAGSLETFRSWYIRWIGTVTFLYWITLFISTHIPLPEGALPGSSDKLLHFLAYAGLAWLVGLWVSSTRSLGATHYALILLAVAVYGAADELLQGPINRTPDVQDWIADVIGGVGGLLLLFVMRQLYGYFRTRDMATDIETSPSDS